MSSGDFEVIKVLFIVVFELIFESLLIQEDLLVINLGIRLLICDMKCGLLALNIEHDFVRVGC